MKNSMEVIKEEMSSEEFEKAQASGLVFKNKEEAQAAAQMYEMQLEEQLYFETQILINRFEKEWREEELNAMTEKEREDFLEKERRRNLPENIYWSALVSEIFRQAEEKKRKKKQEERLLEKQKQERLKKIEDQLTMKPATN